MLELRLRTRDGGWRSIQGQATLRFLNGRAIAVEITGRDVTRMRAAEDTRRQLSTQLEALVASAPDGIIMADAEGRIVRHQRAGLHADGAGDRPERADGPGPGVCSAARCAGCSSTRSARSRTCARWPTANEPVRFIHFECNDGRRVGFDFVPLRDDGGRLWTFRDVTHFKLVEEEQRGSWRR